MTSIGRRYLLILFGAAGFTLLNAACVPVTPVACDAPAIVVTKTADTNDGACSAGDCSLREAVLRANACAGGQTIQVPAGTYTLTLAGAGEDAAATGDLDLTGDATFVGTGRPVIDGNAQDRVFEVFPGVTASFTNFVIRNGSAPFGAGIRSRGTLNVDTCTVEDNIAVRPAGSGVPGRGGGILSDGPGNLGVYISDLTGNSAEEGGGIAVSPPAGASPEVMISYTRIATNDASFAGGGLWLGAGTEATAVNFEVDENIAGANGNGIYNAGSLEITDGSIEDNVEGPLGGGAGGSLRLEDTLKPKAVAFRVETIGDGFAGEAVRLGGGRKGGGIYNASGGTVIARQILLQGNTSGGGGGIYNLGMTHFYNSALLSNEVTGQGGGASNFGAGAGLLLNNTTVSANTAVFGGGGIYNENGGLQLMFVTLYSNDSEGIRSNAAPDMTMRNTIFSTNMDGSCFGTPPDSIGHNIDDGNSCLLDEPSDMPNTDPMVLPLAMNGGPTPTNALADGSPAVDSADPDRCDGNDQRLVLRPQGPNCDRGAYEKDAAAAGSGVISGKVWRDLCALPDGPLPVTAPPGCIPLGDYFGANGILEAIEPGIANVHVRLGSGVCPAFGAAEAVTDAGGLFSFTGLAAGIYCVSIDALSGPNIPALIPGGWSYPVREVTVARAEFTLGDGETRSDANFGWDYQFDSGWPEPTPTPTATPTATPTPAPISFGKPWFSADRFYYYYGGQCKPLEIQFKIQVLNSNLVHSVGMFFQLEDKSTGEKTGWSSGFSMTPLGGGYFNLTMKSQDLPGANSYAEAWLRYQFVANDKSGEALLHSAAFRDITLSRCGKPTTR
jgi:CSLREA domain-containing protein